MTIGEVVYHKDIIILPEGGIISPWWRMEGHRLASEDIGVLLDTAPEVIIAGTGASGFMQPTPELGELLAGRSIEFIVQPTAEAVKTYNRLSDSRKTGACFHLTC